MLAETVPSIGMQIFALAMVALAGGGTILDIIHKKNVKYFFNNAKKAKLSATKNLSSGEKISVVTKTIAHDILTTAELGATQRRIAHVMGMYGTVLFWIGSAVMIFKYSTPGNKHSFSLANYLACRSYHDRCRWWMVLVIFKSRCVGGG